MDRRNANGDNCVMSSFDFLDFDSFDESAPEDMYCSKWLVFDCHRCIIYGVSCYYNDVPPSAVFEFQEILLIYWKDVQTQNDSIT